ncbi:unnamed protein product [Rodentolepis nana]|uniref:ANK_REP_REGION domain-containing protein n=1 Tax=Rodentolepis nana TaxID=102285 RepID=A0A0R3TBB1_RODNA|nr:unnamed protein product [Rodentolepis nana]
MIEKQLTKHLFKAVEKGDITATVNLIRAGANVNRRADIDDATPLITAAEKENLEMMEMLLNYGANVHAKNSDYECVIRISASKGHLEGVLRIYFDIVKLLFDAPDPSRDRTEELNHAILWATISKDPSVVKILLERNADPNFSDSAESPPIFSAIHDKNLEILNLLIDYKANVNARSGNDHTPLMAAVMVESETIVKRLIEAGNDVVNSLPDFI